MIDSLERCLELAQGSCILDDLGLTSRGYGLVTLHRPSNVDSEEDLQRILQVLAELGRELTVIYPVHPRARSRVVRLLQAHHADAETGDDPGRGIRLIDPLGYIDFLALMRSARLVVTDSGGVQEETTVLGVPCVTVRTTTERPITISEGTNRLVPPSQPAVMLAALRDVLEHEAPYVSRRPELWDGRAGERIVAAIAEWCAAGGLAEG